MHARLLIWRLHNPHMHDSCEERSENDDCIISRVLANECDATVATMRTGMKEPEVREVPGFAHHFQYSAQSLICLKPNIQASFLTRGTTDNV